jgi:hypothetical protein
MGSSIGYIEGDRAVFHSKDTLNLFHEKLEGIFTFKLEIVNEF